MSAVAEAFVLKEPAGALDACPDCGNSSPVVWFRSAGKCAHCEAERVRARAMALECDRTAHEIALRSSLQKIRVMCLVSSDGWIDPTFALIGLGREASELAMSIEYLTLRGLTRPHPSDVGVFKVVLPL